MHTQQVSLYNTGMKQLLSHLCKKSLQEKQQALFRIHGKGITRLSIVIFIIMLASGEGKELLIDQYHHRLEVYALHVIIPTIDVNSCTTLV